MKSFIFTFTSVFVILFFIFVLQAVWLFIGDLAGKDLDFILILKFLLFKMPGIVPLFLPLSILLASIMTFGSFSENYEFAAIKSSGISLQRIMRTLTIFMVFIGIVSFYFANNIIPASEYKFINFRRNIAQIKPALALTEGQFSQIGDYNIKVEKKSGDNGRLLNNITIHELSNLGYGSNTVIKAKNGELVSNKDSNILKLILKDGNYYEDIIPNKFEDRDKLPFAKSEFKTYVINIDLSKLNNPNEEEGEVAGSNSMLNVEELKFTLDSLQNNYNKDLVSYADNIVQKNYSSSFGVKNEVNTKKVSLSQNLLREFTSSEKSQILKSAMTNIQNINYSLDNTKFDLEFKQKNINSHWIAFYEKFVIAYACLLMFFIGAPLGAIIRKGGIGLPIVFAVLIFIIYHFTNTFGRKVAQENGISPFLGCWMSSIILTPLAIILTYKATNDISMINLDILLQPFQKLLTKSFFKKANNSNNEQ